MEVLEAASHVPARFGNLMNGRALPLVAREEFVDAMVILDQALDTLDNVVEVARFGRLPLKVLLSIFDLVAVDTPAEVDGCGMINVRGWLVVTQVCQSWRNAVLNDALLWASQYTHLVTAATAFRNLARSAGYHYILSNRANPQHCLPAQRVRNIIDSTNFTNIAKMTIDQCANLSAHFLRLAEGPGLPMLEYLEVEQHMTTSCSHPSAFWDDARCLYTPNLKFAIMHNTWLNFKSHRLIKLEARCGDRSQRFITPAMVYDCLTCGGAEATVENITLFDVLVYDANSLWHPALTMDLGALRALNITGDTQSTAAFLAYLDYGHARLEVIAIPTQGSTDIEEELRSVFGFVEYDHVDTMRISFRSDDDGAMYFVVCGWDVRTEGRATIQDISDPVVSVSFSADLPGLLWSELVQDVVFREYEGILQVLIFDVELPDILSVPCGYWASIIENNIHLNLIHPHRTIQKLITECGHVHDAAKRMDRFVNISDDI